MHDAIHDLVQSISIGDCRRLEDGVLERTEAMSGTVTLTLDICHIPARTLGPLRLKHFFNSIGCGHFNCCVDTNHTLQGFLIAYFYK